MHNDYSIHIGIFPFSDVCYVFTYLGPLKYKILLLFTSEFVSIIETIVQNLIENMLEVL